MRTTTSPSLLLVVAVAAGLAANLLVQAAYSGLPPLPLLAGVVLGALGIGEAVLAEVLHARIRGRAGSRPVDALGTAQAVALAKASALAGAIVGGAWAGLLAFLLPRRSEITAAAGDVPAAVVGVVGSVLLVAGALWLEYRCRIPEDDRDEHRDVR
jgi:hypothetical protein